MANDVKKNSYILVRKRYPCKVVSCLDSLVSIFSLSLSEQVDSLRRWNSGAARLASMEAARSALWPLLSSPARSMRKCTTLLTRWIFRALYGLFQMRVPLPSSPFLICSKAEVPEVKKAELQVLDVERDIQRIYCSSPRQYPVLLRQRLSQRLSQSSSSWR